MSKPPIPYVKDWKFKAHAHIPPPPPSDNKFKYRRWPDLRRNFARRTEEPERYVNPVERCLLCPPQKGSTGSFNIYLRIVKLLNANKETNTNTPIAIVEVLQTSSPLSSQGQNLTPGKRLLAKIYDPLYGRDEKDNDSPFRFADQHYINEVAVYEKLSDLQGVRIPKCYGSFTFNLPVDPAYLSKKIEKPTRSVRLLLLEYVYRRPMDGFPNPKERFSQADRKRIVKEIIEFDTIMFARDVKNCDLYPRNVMLDYSKERVEYEPNKRTCHLKSVAVIDFGHIKLREKDSIYYHGDYVSPLLRFHGCNFYNIHEFKDWIDWDWQPWLEEEFADTAHRMTDELKNVYLIRRSLEKFYGGKDFHISPIYGEVV